MCQRLPHPPMFKVGGGFVEAAVFSARAKIELGGGGVFGNCFPLPQIPPPLRRPRLPRPCPSVPFSNAFASLLSLYYEGLTAGAADPGGRPV
eukprot:873252-Pyramimonas_sp.AAC.1